MLILARFLT